MRTLAIALAVLAPAALLAVACGSGGAHAGSGHSASGAVLAAQLKAAGLPITHLIVYTPATDPNQEMGRQGGYTSKVAWQDPRAAKADAGDTRGSIGLGGGIEVYPTAAGAQARYQYLKDFKPPFGDGYDYLSGTAVLRLSQYLVPTQAHAYEAAFATAAR